MENTSVMTCANCEKEFNPAPFHYHQKFCSRECYTQYQKSKPRRLLMAQVTFEREWAQWKKDFAAGKTVKGCSA